MNIKFSIKTIIVILVLIVSKNILAIEGGTLAEEKRWDYSVQLFMNGKSCSGTLLNNGYVLTAAHCVTDDNGKVNVESVRIENPRETIGDAKLVFVDPEYNAKELLNDVALLRFDSSDKSNKYPRISKIMTPTRFLEMLGGKFPHRKSMIIGYGKDENGDSGRRKIFFGNDFGISPKAEMLEADANTGASRPGDSGSGVYLISDGKQTLSAVVSKGTQQYTSLHSKSERQKKAYTKKISADSFIVPSLCRVNQNLASQISFDQTNCDDVNHYLGILDEADEDSLLYLLWVRAMIENSPLTESAYHRYLSRLYLYKSFSAGAIYNPALSDEYDFISKIQSSVGGGYTKKLNSEVENMIDVFVNLGYMASKPSPSVRLDPRPLKKTLGHIKENSNSIFKKLRNLRRSAKCEFNICSGKFQKLGTSLFGYSEERLSWSGLLKPKTKKTKKRIKDYNYFLSILCDHNELNSFRENVKHIFEELGFYEKGLSETIDESNDEYHLTQSGIEIYIKNGFKDSITVADLQISESKFNQLIKSFELDNIVSDYYDTENPIVFDFSYKENKLKIFDVDFLRSKYKPYHTHIFFSGNPRGKSLDSYNSLIDKIFNCQSIN